MAKAITATEGFALRGLIVLIENKRRTLCLYMFTHKHIYVYMYIYPCVCLCISVHMHTHMNACVSAYTHTKHHPYIRWNDFALIIWWDKLILNIANVSECGTRGALNQAWQESAPLLAAKSSLAKDQCQHLLFSPCLSTLTCFLHGDVRGRISRHAQGHRDQKLFVTRDFRGWRGIPYLFNRILDK